MTKPELLEKAKGLGLEVDDTLSKQELETLIEEAESKEEKPVEENIKKVNNVKSKYGAGKTFQPAKL